MKSVVGYYFKKKLSISVTNGEKLKEISEIKDQMLERRSSRPKYTTNPSWRCVFVLCAPFVKPLHCFH
jgi:hypothetical protein